MPAIPKLKTTKTLSIATLAPTLFYTVVGVIFLILLPLSNYPPHIAVTGIISIITAYALFTKRSWAKWLVTALFLAATTLALCTLYYTITSNWIISIGFIAYVALTWLFTARILLKK